MDMSGIKPERFWAKVSGARRREGAVLNTQAKPDGVAEDDVDMLVEVELIRRQGEEDERRMTALKDELARFMARHVALDGTLPHSFESHSLG